MAEALRLPTYAWYTPLWHGVHSVLQGRYDDAAAHRERARALGTAAGDANAELFTDMLGYGDRFLHAAWSDEDFAFVQEQIRTSPAGIAYRSAYTWMLAATGRTDEARANLAALAVDRFAAIPVDANWISAMAELSEAVLLLGDRARAAVLQELLGPYRGSTACSGRAVGQYGLVADFLGRLGLLLDAPGAVAELERALAFYDRHGWEPFAGRVRAALAGVDRGANRPADALDRASMGRDRRIG
jgi:hypothetical protein